jgi:hypothetical protein
MHALDTVRSATVAFRSDPYAAIAQAVYNGFDGGATRVVIQIADVQGVLSLRVVDDGRGMGPEEQARFFGLGHRNRRNDGHGRHGTGSKAGVHHSRALSVETRTNGGDLRRLGPCSWDEFSRAILARDASLVPTSRGRLPANHAIRTTGTVFHWLDLTGPAEQWTADALINGMVQHLSARELHHTCVEDLRGGGATRRRRLKEPKYEGKKIEAAGEILDVGPVACSLVVLDRPKQMHDGVWLCGPAPVCLWWDFATRLQGDSWQLLRFIEAMCHTRLVGRIEIPAWNAWSSSDRRSFVPELFQTKVGAKQVLAFLSWIGSAVVPKVQAELAAGGNGARDKGDEDLIRDLVREFRKASGGPAVFGDYVQVSGDSLWRVAPAQVELLPGEVDTLRIVGALPDETFVWQATAGTVTAAGRGVEATFATSTVGEYKLTVSCTSGSPVRKAHTVTVEVTVRADLALAASPSRVTMLPGEVRTVRVLHVGTRGVRWYSEGDVTLEQSEDGHLLTITSGKNPGSYLMTAMMRGKTVLTLPVTVVVERTPRGEGGGSGESVELYDPLAFCIGEYFYRLIQDRFGAGGALSVFLRGRGRFGESGSTPAQISINLDHPVFRGADPQQQRAIIRQLVSTRVAQNEDAGAEPEELHERASEVLRLLCGASKNGD